MLVVIINSCFIISIIHHNSLHGFREGHSTRAATLKVKLLLQLTAMREEVLHATFLDFQKAYNALDRSRCMDILEGYDVGTRAL